MMANKPESELWIVILNEFTEAGIDALNVAQAARGNYDVRMVSGGCLCCVGELEFAKQLRDILRNFKPARLLIEPSGAGHAADIVDALGAYEKQNALSLDSVICLVDSLDAVRIERAREFNEWSQIQSADALLLSKPDLAGAGERQAFDAIAAAQYPAKRFIGTCSHGELPPAAIGPYERAARFSLFDPVVAVPVRAAAPIFSEFTIAGLTGSESHTQQLGQWAVQWTMPAELTFSRVILDARLRWLLEANGAWLRRMKAVFRTGPGPSWLVQSAGHGMSAEDSAYRRDSRIEMVMSAAPSEQFLEGCRALLRDAANPPRR
jgi:G3E family GTPase